MSSTATTAANTPSAPPVPARPSDVELVHGHDLTDGHYGKAAPLKYRPPAKSIEDDEHTVNTQRPANSDSQPFVDLYEKDRERSRLLYLYCRWVNPCFRWLIIIVILYLYALSSGALTYRNIQFQGEMQWLLNVEWNRLNGVTDPSQITTMLPRGIRPEREEGVDFHFIYNEQPQVAYNFVPFILKDLWFEFIPALQGDLRSRWLSFADATPIIFNVGMLILLLLRRDVIRLTEYLAIQMVMFAVNAVVHVSTTYPDAGGYQGACLEDQHQTYGGWIWRMVTTQYCGDMLWSGHTANTLVPLIMCRRLMWDFLGWNLSWGEKVHVGAGDSTTRREQMIEKHSWIFSAWHNDHERNQLFQQFIHQTQLGPAAGAQSLPQPVAGASLPHSYPGTDAGQHAVMTSGMNVGPNMPKQLENYSPKYAAATLAGAQVPLEPNIPPAGNGAAGIDVAHASAVADEIALQEHENHDIHINVHAATTLAPHQRPNLDHDIFFKIYKSPYRTPDFVERHRKLFFVFTSLLRVALIVWFTMLVITIVLIRFHYSDDVIIACFVTLLVTTNTYLLQWMVRFLYRPYYHNYVYTAPWQPVYLRWPLNTEQINYEERVRRVGVGGIL